MPHLCHVLTQLAQAKAQPLDQQARVPAGEIDLALEGGIPWGGQQAQQGGQHVGLRTQRLAARVALTHDGEHKAGLCARAARPVLLEVEVIDEVDVAVVLHQILQPRQKPFRHTACAPRDQLLLNA